MEIAPDVYQVPNVVGSNVILLTGDRMAVIDTGVKNNGDAICSFIDSLGRRAEDLDAIVLTHFHYDHSGSAAELHQRTGAKILAHVAETETKRDGRRFLLKGHEGDKPPKWYSWWYGRRSGIEYPDTLIHETFDDGDVLPYLGGLLVIHMPGHTPGGVGLYLQDRKVLFVGDSVLNNIDRLSRPLMWSKARRDELDRSLQKLRELDARICCFGHGPVLTEEVMAKVRFLTARPYNVPTWRIVLKHWRTLRRFRNSSRRRGHWEGGKR